MISWLTESSADWPDLLEPEPAAVCQLKAADVPQVDIFKVDNLEALRLLGCKNNWHKMAKKEILVKISKSTNKFNCQKNFYEQNFKNC